MSTRTAIYLRVSSEKQDSDNQIPDVQQLARARQLDVVRTYTETASARKHRPEHERMLADARRGEFTTLLIWALDRFGRSMVGNLQDVLELDRIGVQVISVRESWLDTASPTRTLLIAVFSWIAEQELLRLRERTLAGLDRARRAGKKLGRRPTTALRVDLDELFERRAAGDTLRLLAERFGVSMGAIQRALATPACCVCRECSSPVVCDLHGRARWHRSPGSEYACAGFGQPAAILSETPLAS